MCPNFGRADLLGETSVFVDKPRFSKYVSGRVFQLFSRRFLLLFHVGRFWKKKNKKKKEQVCKTRQEKNGMKNDKKR